MRRPGACGTGRSHAHRWRQSQRHRLGQDGIVAGQGALPAEVVEARVAAILDDGLVRFTTAFGPLDLAVAQKLAVGDRARILVENTGARLTLTLLNAVGAPAGHSAPGAAPADAAAQHGRRGPPHRPNPHSRLRQPAPRQTGGARPAGDGALGPRHAAARFCPRLPPRRRAGGRERRRASSRRTAAAGVLSQVLRIDAPLDANTLADAARRSGVFSEALAANGAAAAPDMKQALATLRAALAAWTPVPVVSLASPGLPASAAAPAPTSPPAAGPEPPRSRHPARRPRRTSRKLPLQRPSPSVRSPRPPLSCLRTSSPPRGPHRHSRRPPRPPRAKARRSLPLWPLP